jgi:hypothetical protein
MKSLSQEQATKWFLNLLKFTAPVLGVIFYQLSIGVPLEAAVPLALYAFYALMADLMKKMEQV